jgi:hypothetical protein
MGRIDFDVSEFELMRIVLGIIVRMRCDATLKESRPRP